MPTKQVKDNKKSKVKKIKKRKGYENFPYGFPLSGKHSLVLTR